MSNAGPSAIPSMATPPNVAASASLNNESALKNADPSAPKPAVPPGSANNAGQRLQHLLREADATIERYAAYAGVTLRPAHGPIGRSINANAVYSKLVQDGTYDPEVAAEANNFLADMRNIGKQADMHFNLQEPKDVLLNPVKADPELAKLVKEMYRNELATRNHKADNGDKEPLRGDGSKAAAPAAPNKASMAPDPNGDLPRLTPGDATTTTVSGPAQKPSGSANPPVGNNAASEPLW
jgi:hypothetical protein